MIDQPPRQFVKAVNVLLRKLEALCGCGTSGWPLSTKQPTGTGAPQKGIAYKQSINILIVSPQIFVVNK
ncbi:hypothetical protein [Paenibacillus sonchi]|uniref:hypothetical protein n=1 Tax=Paenibacillus sonchi TaxID=373687 RepID=UPI0002DB32CF|nr:hypothetical protein [Paenibacillus sonchi]